jgi:hypothetical protein
MARYQIEEQLDQRDKRCKGVQREYDALPKNPFLAAFYEKYGTAFHLETKRDIRPDNGMPIEGASMPLRSQEQEQEQKQEKKPSAAAASVADDADPIGQRHASTRRLIQELHLRKFRVTCPWDGSEGRTLGRLLSANPSWTQEQVVEMVANRFRSEGIASDRPRKWLANLGSYAAGPLDRFNKLRGPHGDAKCSSHRPSDSQFAHPVPEITPCPFGVCDGGGWYVDRNTRARVDCKCRESRKAAVSDSDRHVVSPVF